MSILKGILHHWNKTSSAYDTIHPETEYAQVTDWNKGIGATLASTAIGGLVSTLTSDSLFATLLKKAMTALGVKYLAAQNGYVCLGDIFGWIIIQWVSFTACQGTHQISFPLAFPNMCASILVGTNDSDDSTVYAFHAAGYTLSAFNYVYTHTVAKDARCIALGW